VFFMVALAWVGLQAQSAPRGTWIEKAKLGEVRTEPGTASLNGKVYVIGGMARGQDSHPLNQEYDVRTDTWRERAPMPSPLSHPAAVALNDRIYVVGGFLRNVHLDAQDKVYEYDPRTDTWRTLAPLKSPRGSVGLAVVNGKIHAIGGRDVNRVTVNTHEVFDPKTGAWTELAPLPQPRDHSYVAAFNREIHVIGGRLNTPVENVDTHDVYDTVSNTWKPGPRMPTPRSGGGAVLYRGSIVVFGGECDNGRPFAQVEAFDLKSGRWSTLAAMPSGRHGITAATDGQVIFAPAGAPNCATASSDTMQVFRF
jgi:N-acetylneuraminic acid mutarotase